MIQHQNVHILLISLHVQCGTHDVSAVVATCFQSGYHSVSHKLYTKLYNLEDIKSPFGRFASPKHTKAVYLFRTYLTDLNWLSLDLILNVGEGPHLVWITVSFLPFE